jgi:5-hydroxyisourate hydrolase
MARISTHVLDTSQGAPASGIPIDLHFDGKLIASAITNSDGRTAAPLLTADRIAPGHYELIFHVGKDFYDRITIRFAVTDEHGHYHIPLLLSPYGYTTYRGS